MTLGERMLRYRAIHKINQATLAERLGTYPNNISRIESGKYSPHKANELRLSIKLKELEEQEDGI